LRNIVITAIAGIGALAMTAAQRSPWLVWNASTSVPIGLYRTDGSAPLRGELALLRLPMTIANVANERGYLARSAYLLKPVAAVGGDRVCRFGSAIFVRGRLSASADVQDTHGRLLPTWHGCQQLSVTDVFILGATRDSFDSRYFGPIAGDHVVGRARPVLIFK